MNRRLRHSSLASLALALGLFLAPTPVGAALVAHLAFDGDLADSSGNGNDGIFNGGDPVFVSDRDGNDGLALSFDGTDDYVELTPTLGLPLYTNEGGVFSIAMWVRGTVSTDVRDRRVFSENSDAGAPLFNLGTASDGQSGKLNFYLRSAANSAVKNHQASAGTLFEEEDWHHLTWVDDNGAVTVYIDGIADATDFSYTRPDLGVVTRTTIGGIFRTSFCCGFLGDIDDVRLYDHALTLNEVQELIVRDDCPAESDTSCTGIEVVGPPDLGIGTYTATAAATDTSGDTELTYVFVAENADNGATLVAGPQPGNTADFLLTPGNWTVSVSIDDDLFCFDSSDLNSCTSDPIVINPPPALTSHWMLDGDLTDAEPAGNDGVLLGAAEATFTEGFDGTPNGAILLDGATLVSAQQNSGLPITANKAYTVTLWVNGASGQSDLRVFSEASTSSNTPLFNLGTQNQGLDGRFDVLIRPSEGTTFGHAYSDREPFDGSWHHIAWVDDNGEAIVYIDGVRDANPFSYTRGVLPVNTTTIGGILRASASNFFNGAIDDVRVYNYALSAEEVHDLIPERPDCPGDADTVVESLSVEGPLDETAGDYTITATASDTSGDDVLYMFTAVRDDGTYRQQGPSTDSVAVLNLTPGDWTITVLADDDLFCHDVAEGASRSETITVLAEPKIRISFLDFEGDLADREPAGNDASILGGGDVPFAVGYDCNSAASFDGTNFLSLAQNDKLAVSERATYSIAMWVNGAPQSDKRVFNESMSTDTNPLFNIGTDNTGGTGAVDMYVRNGSTFVPHLHTEGIAFDGTWHHITFTYDEGVGAIYVDGVRDPTDFSFPLQAWDLDITTIGGIQRDTSCCQFTGLIDDVGIYNYVLADDEILALVGEGPSDDCCPIDGDTHCDGLGITLSDFDEGAGTAKVTLAATATDDSGDSPSYTFTIDNGVDPATVIGPQASPETDITLPFGTYDLSVSVDDDPLCDDVADNATCTEASYEVKLPPPVFRRGDSNGDGVLDISDPLANLGFQFAGTFTPGCKDALDYNDDGMIDISDPIGSLSFQFAGTGDPPAPPGTESCDVDPTPEVEEIGCEEYLKC